MDLQAIPSGNAGAAATAVAAVARAASHLTGRQIVPALATVTVLLLTLVILFGPEGPLSASRRLTRPSRTASQPADSAEPQHQVGRRSRAT